MVYLSNGIAMITIVSWQVPYKYHFDAHQKVKVVHSSISKSNYECIPKSVAHTQVCVFLSVHKGKGGGTPVSGPRSFLGKGRGYPSLWSQALCSQESEQGYFLARLRFPFPTRTGGLGYPFPLQPGLGYPLPPTWQGQVAPRMVRLLRFPVGWLFLSQILCNTFYRCIECL